jgi:hypothetical protein
MYPWSWQLKHLAQQASWLVRPWAAMGLSWLSSLLPCVVQLSVDLQEAFLLCPRLASWQLMHQALQLVRPLLMGLSKMMKMLPRMLQLQAKLRAAFLLRTRLLKW